MFRQKLISNSLFIKIVPKYHFPLNFHSCGISDISTINPLGHTFNTQPNFSFSSQLPPIPPKDPKDQGQESSGSEYDSISDSSSTSEKFDTLLYRSAHNGKLKIISWVALVQLLGTAVIGPQLISAATEMAGMPFFLQLFVGGSSFLFAIGLTAITNWIRSHAVAEIALDNQVSGVPDTEKNLIIGLLNWKGGIDYTSIPIRDIRPYVGFPHLNSTQIMVDRLKEEAKADSNKETIQKELMYTFLVDGNRYLIFQPSEGGDFDYLDTLLSSCQPEPFYFPGETKDANNAEAYAAADFSESEYDTEYETDFETEKEQPESEAESESERKNKK